ncbi:MAG TPA: BlaI/MecI/CopY family transcriptional regulator [Candidatus Paceibacterota bacterium]|nr:BlaI/MecI/CopY family transcriptional regulator [Candidatus Paceibacterota bacterium]
MDKEKVLKIIGQVEALLTELKGEIGVSDQAVSPKGRKKVPKKSRQSKKSGSVKPIQDLIESGFFDTPKTSVQVVEILEKKAQFFDQSNVATTLMRLVKKGVLERERSGAKNNPWTYKKK